MKDKKMIHLKLIRISQSIDSTWGVFINNLDNKPICLSLERPWKDNLAFKSCIPKGKYKVVKYRKELQLWILDVPGRTYILIHIANWPEQLQGCIAPGSEFSKRGVLNSGISIMKLNDFFESVCEIDDEGVEFINLEISGH